MLWIECSSIFKNIHCFFLSVFTLDAIIWTDNHGILAFKIDVAFMLSGNAKAKKETIITLFEKIPYKYLSNEEEKVLPYRINVTGKRLFAYLRILLHFIFLSRYFRAKQFTLSLFSVLHLTNCVFALHWLRLHKRLIHQLLFDKLMCQIECFLYFFYPKPILRRWIDFYSPKNA